MLLDELDIQVVYGNKDVPVNNPFQWNQLKTALNKLVWMWYDYEMKVNPEKDLFTLKKFGFISFTVRMKHLEPFIHFAFGDDTK